MPSHLVSLSQTSDTTHTAALNPPTTNSIGTIERAFNNSDVRQITFFFSGRLLLWLPERVCSIRHVIGSELLARTDTVIMNITENQSYGPIKSALLDNQLNSLFCLVARSDSYSSASFYDALQAGCIPIVLRYAHNSLYILTPCRSSLYFSLSLTMSLSLDASLSFSPSLSLSPSLFSLFLHLHPPIRNLKIERMRCVILVQDLQAHH